MRTAGILMPITSLPSPYGVGTLGQCARDFIQFLHRAGQTYWQILPICPTGYGDSPYQSFSSYAGNPYMIDFDDLKEKGLLQEEEYASLSWGDQPTTVDYGLLYGHKFTVLKTACSRISGALSEQFQKFCKEQKFWLDDYALYMSIKDYHGGQSWKEWPETLQKREKDSLEAIHQELTDEILFWKKVQFLFFYQWDRLKAYAEENNIKIIGDLPIYVSYDSADVWAHPEEFQLDENLCPIEVAGCPPDGFSADGQLWGNPLFNWDYMKETGYQWWVNRIAYQSKIYDVIRIDHFRGFDEYYAIPYGDSTAKNGHWKPGPGMDLFTTIENKLGKLPIIAEDLGFLTDSVKQLLASTGFPGMKVLEFAFDSRDTGSGYLPHCYPNNCIVYTGTHDNDTILGWFETAPEEFQNNAIRYLRLTKEEGYHIGMMRCAWASVADTAIMQMQDFLGLGVEGRMNTPSTLGGNWTWRCLPGDYNDELADWLYEETKIYGRLN
ncbi:MAG: 4-alpha-glucanotransferase [Anaerobutyricum soehngenii]|mgnify:CR=1 FL=1